VETCYKDKLIEITDREIVFSQYYFPSGTKRSVALDEVASVRVVPSAWQRGRYRVWGSDDLRAWFPCDWSRPSRDRIFYLQLKPDSSARSWPEKLRNCMTGRAARTVGFTVEDSKKVADIFQEKGLLQGLPTP